MALQHTKGTISFMSEVESGVSRNGNEWQRMSILIDMPGFQGAIYKINLSVSGAKVDDVLKFKVGDKVDVSWSIYAREYNGKWYNQVDLVKIEDADLPEAQERPAPAATAPQARRSAVARQVAPMVTAPGELDPNNYDDLGF